MSAARVFLNTRPYGVPRRAGRRVRHHDNRLRKDNGSCQFHFLNASAENPRSSGRRETTALVADRERDVERHVSTSRSPVSGLPEGEYVDQMKIRPSGLWQVDDRSALDALVRQRSSPAVRPCDGCTKPCPCPKRSQTCCCGCEVECSEIPRALSSEPDRYPIESKIIPLVFAVAELREIVPCWSCEGHVRHDGDWVREPQVWFYSNRTVYPDLMTRHFSKMHAAKAVGHLWEIVVSAFSASATTTFTIRPVLKQQLSAGDELAELWREIPVLAKDLRESVLDQAAKRLTG